jgi:hypothetical protein
MPPNALDYEYNCEVYRNGRWVHSYALDGEDPASLTEACELLANIHGDIRRVSYYPTTSWVYVAGQDFNEIQNAQLLNELVSSLAIFYHHETRSFGQWGSRVTTSQPVFSTPAPPSLPTEEPEYMPPVAPTAAASPDITVSPVTGDAPTALVDVRIQRGTDNVLVLKIDARNLHKELELWGVSSDETDYLNGPQSTTRVIGGNNNRVTTYALLKKGIVTANLSRLFSTPPTRAVLLDIANSVQEAVNLIRDHYQPIDICVSVVKTPVTRGR